MISVKIYKVDPYTRAGGFIVAEIAQRLIKQAHEHGEPLDDILVLMSRIWAADPGVVFHAALDDKGVVKGYAIAAVESGSLFMFQPRVDEPTKGDTIGEFVALVEKWLKGYNSTVSELNHIPGINLIARRADPKWAKKYGFTTTKYIMFKPLGE